MPSDPLVSCIMPTRGRPEFAQRALEMFQRQRWPQKELIVCDNATSPSFPNWARPPHAFRIWDYCGQNIGVLRNYVCSIAHGDFIMHWDDDDFYAPGRIEMQVRHLIETGRQVTGFRGMMFVDLATGERWKYHASTGAVGVSLCYRRSYWESHKFDSVPVAEDGTFARRAEPVAAYEENAGTLIIATIHSGNTSKREPGKHPRQWQRLP